jgi:hypothetical protein
VKAYNDSTQGERFMPVAVICCKTLELEIGRLLEEYDNDFRVEVLEWALHIEPKKLLDVVTQRIAALEGSGCGAAMLAYGRCQALDRLPPDLPVPVFRPEAEDCIGVLLGQERYAEELMKQAGTWFFTPGWILKGMEGVFADLQLHRMAEKGLDPMEIGKRMLADYRRGLLVDSGVGDLQDWLGRASEITEYFGWELEETRGSLSLLREALEKALEAAGDRPQRKTPPRPT